MSHPWAGWTLGQFLLQEFIGDLEGDIYFTWYVLIVTYLYRRRNVTSRGYRSEGY